VTTDIGHSSATEGNQGTGSGRRASTLRPEPVVPVATRGWQAIGRAPQKNNLKKMMKTVRYYHNNNNSRRILLN